jgi:hypothetical protein
MSQVQVQSQIPTQKVFPVKGSWWYEKRLGIAVENDSVTLPLYTYGRCQATYAEIVYPVKLDLLRVSSRRGEYELELDYAKLLVVSRDSAKNRHRAVTVIPKTTVLVRYYGSISCSKSCNEFILLEPGRDPVALEPISEVREEQVGKYTVLKELLYVVINNEKLKVGEREIERRKLN